jgi:small subunit ribosomal protein S16
VSVKIRLTRMGTIKRPFYRIVAIDSREKRNGEYLENLGIYHPLEEKGEAAGTATSVIKEDRIKYWLKNGAKPSHTVKSILNKKGISTK